VRARAAIEHDFLQRHDETADITRLAGEVDVPAKCMEKIPGIARLRAVKALERAGFRIARQGSIS
jgi:hypothetical protein